MYADYFWVLQIYVFEALARAICTYFLLLHLGVLPPPPPPIPKSWLRYWVPLYYNLIDNKDSYKPSSRRLTKWLISPTLSCLSISNHTSLYVCFASYEKFHPLCFVHKILPVLYGRYCFWYFTSIYKIFKKLTEPMFLPPRHLVNELFQVLCT